MSRPKKMDSLKNAFQTGLKDQFTRGLSQGSKAMAGAILATAQRPDLTAEQRLQEIIEFCQRSLGVKDSVK